MNLAQELRNKYKQERIDKVKGNHTSLLNKIKKVAETGGTSMEVNLFDSSNSRLLLNILEKDDGFKVKTKEIVGLQGDRVLCSLVEW